MMKHMGSLNTVDCSVNDLHFHRTVSAHYSVQPGREKDLTEITKYTVCNGDNCTYFLI